VLHRSNEVVGPFGGVVTCDWNASAGPHGFSERAPVMPDVGDVEQATPLVVFGSLRKESFRLNSVSVLLAVLRK
jgi:hypothetical protein